ncbi:hypothetical protein [Candidatus Accumulibacter phosphatis]|uniref:hypothetical protein n=1 Tax=Candidatus Accumulibacter phosphatis TaxID=327160 RepID=UPI001485DEEE|nr:hypothetical protein [Candidatus Accumulibacter phosphatis]
MLPVTRSNSLADFSWAKAAVHGLLPAWQAVVFCNNSDAFTTTFKTAVGSGVVVAKGKPALLLSDGTNVVCVTPDS